MLVIICRYNTTIIVVYRYLLFTITLLVFRLFQFVFTVIYLKCLLLSSHCCNLFFLFVDSIMVASAFVANNSHFKIDRCSPLWKYVEILRPMLGGGGCVWICNHCKEESSSSYSRVKAHLCFISQKDIKFCTGKPRANGKLPKILFPNHIVNKYIQEQKQADEAAGRASATQLLQSDRASKKGKMPSMSSTSDTNKPPA